MTVTISSSPQYPLPGSQVTVSLTTTEPLANFVAVRPISAPPNSELAGKLAKLTPGTRYESGRVDLGSGSEFSFSSAAPGVFTFELDELQVTTVPPTAEGETQQSTETVLAVSTVKLFIGERVDVPLGFGTDSATLVLFFWDDQIRETTLAQHNIVSPAIVKPKSQMAAVAAVDPVVVAAMRELVGKSGTSLAEELETCFSAVRLRVSAHVKSTASGGGHNNTDTDNDISSTVKISDSARGNQLAVTKLYQALDTHVASLNLRDPVITPPATITFTPVHTEAEGTSSYRTSGPGRSVVSQILCVMDVWNRLLAHADIASAHDSVATPSPWTIPPLANLMNEWLLAIRPIGDMTDVHRNKGAALVSTML